MVKTILIISSDDEYNISIEQRLACVLNEDVRFELISNISYLAQYLKTPHTINVLICDAGLLLSTNGIIKAEKVYVLTESATTKGGEISKYGGADSIIKELDESFLKKSANDSTRDTKMIGVCSPIGGSGKTVSAIGICLRLSEMGKKVLYINAESFQTFRSVIDKSSAFVNSRYTYMTDEVKRSIAAQSPNVSETILRNVTKGKFDYIPQSDDILSLYQITEDKIYHMACEIRDKKIYDYIVLEYESGLTASRIPQLFECERLLMVTKQDKESADRLSRFVQMLATDLVQMNIVCARCKANEANEIYSIELLKDNQICEYIPEKINLSEIFESKEGNNYYRKSAEAVL